MDKRLPHRIREIRQKFQDAGKRCDSDGVREELVRAYPEYNRVKQQPLKRMITQELSTPPPAPPSTSPSAPEAPEGVEPRRKRPRRAGARAREDAGATPLEAAVPEASADDRGEQVQAQDLNNSLRRMYNPQASATTDTSTPTSSKASAVRQSARERKAMAAARREKGLPESSGSKGFEPSERPEERLEDLGGIDTILADLRQLVVQPLTHPEVYAHLGVQPPTGVLLHGPPGTGKTKLVHALAGSTGVAFFKVAATEIVSGMSGESEAKIRQLFQAAIAAAPSLLFLDEVDSITPRRDSAGREMERRIVAQLLTSMDELQNCNVVVMGATNRPDALDPALRRAGRFDREISMGIPDEAARKRILEKMTSGMRLAGDVDVALLAKLTPGFVGADLSALTKEAAMTTVARAFARLDAGRSSPAEDADAKPAPYSLEELADIAVEVDDFHLALTKVQPSAKREGFTTIPDVTWEDVGALADVRDDLDAAVCEPIRKVELFKQMGLTVPVGVLLFGPPGCGKTLLAKATANASGANFISVKGPELLNKYVGESERAVRLVFQRAQSSAPCVIFFDELDALVPRRSGEGSSGAERVVNQMLTEMDGVGARAQVYVIAATNRPDIVDPAMLRPGRLDKLLFVPFPSEMGRLDILRAHTKRMPLDEDVDLQAVAKEAEGFSGADLAALVREAAMIAIRRADVPAKPAPEPAPLAVEVVEPLAEREANEQTVDAGEVATAPVATATESTPPADVVTATESTPPADAEVRVLITAVVLAEARRKVSASVSAKERREYEELAEKIRSGRSG